MGMTMTDRQGNYRGSSRASFTKQNVVKFAETFEKPIGDLTKVEYLEGGAFVEFTDLDGYKHGYAIKPNGV